MSEIIFCSTELVASKQQSVGKMITWRVTLEPRKPSRKKFRERVYFVQTKGYSTSYERDGREAEAIQEAVEMATLVGYEVGRKFATHIHDFKGFEP